MSNDERQKAMEHIDTCEFCSIAYEGLSGVDINQVKEDLEQVKQHLKVVRPLDFMHEQRGLNFKLKIRLITLAVVAILIALVIYIMNVPLESPNSHVILEENATPFRLETKDTTPARLDRKLPDKKKMWEERFKKQNRQKNEGTE